MSSHPESQAFPGSANGAQGPSHPDTPSNRRESRSDPLSSEDIDAQIRWFFEKMPLKGENLRR